MQNIATHRSLGFSDALTAALTMLTVLTLGIPFALNPARADSSVIITEAWIREAPPTMKVHAGYAVVHNKTDKSLELVAAASPAYAMAELHLSKVENGIATMTKQDQITMPAGGMVRFAPGGFHIMLMHPKKPLKSGDSVEITLRFADGGKETFTAPVKRAHAVPTQQHHMGH